MTTFVLLLMAFPTPGRNVSYFPIVKIRKHGEFSFPVVQVRTAASAKINQLLQLSELRQLADGRNRRLFETARIDDGSNYGGKKSISYQIHANNSRVLSLGFTNSSCGATCRYWASYYNFNSQNGDLMGLRDLFTEEGYKSFTEMVSRTRANKYRAEVSKKVEAEEREGFLSAVGSIEGDDLTDFAIAPKSILIDGENILHKNMKFNGIDMKVRFHLPSFSEHLNEFGKKVFAIRRGSLGGFRSNSLPQLFSGNVDGSSPFVAVLFYDRFEEIEGIYAYLKYRTGIYLTGKLINQEFHLTEHLLTQTDLNLRTDSNHRFEDGGTMSGTFDGSRLDGHWFDKNKTKSLPIKALRDY